MKVASSKEVGKTDSCFAEVPQIFFESCLAENVPIYLVLHNELAGKIVYICTDETTSETLFQMYCRPDSRAGLS